MRHRLSSYRVAPAGGAMLMLLIAAVALLLLGPKHDEVPAFVVIAVILAIFVVGSSPGGLRTRRTFSEYQDLYHPRERGLGDEPEAPADEEMWQRERERRERQSQ